MSVARPWWPPNSGRAQAAWSRWSVSPLCPGAGGLLLSLSLSHICSLVWSTGQLVMMSKSLSVALFSLSCLLTSLVWSWGTSLSVWPTGLMTLLFSFFLTALFLSISLLSLSLLFSLSLWWTIFLLAFVNAIPCMVTAACISFCLHAYLL